MDRENNNQIKMKKARVIVLLAGCLALLRCAPAVRVEYRLPPGIPEQNREHVYALLERGAALYKANCSKCHGIFSRGKETIPNFTHQQVESYKARFDMSHPENHAFAQKMAREELDAVFYFLNNRKIPESAAVTGPGRRHQPAPAAEAVYPGRSAYR